MQQLVHIHGGGRHQAGALLRLDACSGAKEFKGKRFHAVTQPPSPNIPNDTLVGPLRNNSHHMQ